MAIIFNGTSFRDPNSMSEKPKVLSTSEWRSINNTLTKDIWNFTAKREMTLDYDYLTGAEFTTLMSFVDIGGIPVSCNTTGHTFTFSLASVSLESTVEHIYSGARAKVKISIKEK